MGFTRPTWEPPKNSMLKHCKTTRSSTGRSHHVGKSFLVLSSECDPNSSSLIGMSGFAILEAQRKAALLNEVI